MKNKYIFVRYTSNPDYPNETAHKAISNLVKTRTKKFELHEYEEAWKFILECSSPITKLEHILWAFPRKEALSLLKSMDSLKEEITNEVCEELSKDYMSDDDLDTVLRNIKINEENYSELLEYERIS
jgi:hypothetical protein